MRLWLKGLADPVFEVRHRHDANWSWWWFLLSNADVCLIFWGIKSAYKLCATTHQWNRILIPHSQT
jgi:hypothetical protein